MNTQSTQRPSWWKNGIHPNGTVIGCLNCGDTPHVLPFNTQLYNGFGGWTIFKDGSIFYCADPTDDNGYKNCKSLGEIEKIAKCDPEHNWIAELFNPLRGATYQRHYDEGWVLVETNQGFA